jgi:hypothetical protein
MDEDVQIMVAHVNLADGQTVARIERVKLGGGTQAVRVDNTEEIRNHPLTEAFHVRLLSPNPMIPDELRDMETYDEAVELAREYAAKRAEHAEAIDALASSLKV